MVCTAKILHVTFFCKYKERCHYYDYVSIVSIFMFACNAVNICVNNIDVFARRTFQDSQKGGIWDIVSY